MKGGITLIIWLCFMVKNFSSQEIRSLQYHEPIIYLTFARWENRTISPRGFYMLLQKHGYSNKLLNNLKKYQYKTSNEEPPASITVLIKPKSSYRPSDIVPSDPETTQLRTLLPSKKTLINWSATNHTGILPTQLVTVKDGLERSSVVFPSDRSFATRNNGLLKDRIAYPGSTNIRVAGSSPSNQVKSIKGNSLEKDYIADTFSLTIDIIKNSGLDDENALFSPFSITNILAILFLGSNGTTFHELGKRLMPEHPIKLHEKIRERKFHTSFRNLLHQLSLKSGVDLDVCNSLVLDQKYALIKEYSHNARLFYDAQSHIRDFGKDALKVMEELNDWIRYKTKGKITSLIDSPPNPLTSMILLNTVYLRGEWQTPFIKEVTQKKKFYVSSSETIDVSMMGNVLTVPYIETENFRAIALPYKGKKTGFFVLLPTVEGVKGLQIMEESFTSDTLDQFNSMTEEQLTIQIPKMRIDSGTINLKPLLKQFGLNSMFDAGNADFSRISDIPGLHIDSIYHKSIFEMDENGVTAAASTAATADRTLDSGLFNANRPFSFLILNTNTRTVLFYGRVTRPQPLID